VDIIFKGRRTEVQERFRRHASAKLSKIERLDSKTIRVDVEVTAERNPRQADRRERVELTIRSRGPVIRAEAAADDRYAILKGGDAVRLVFDARSLPPVPPGFVRDWLFVSDGWDKDGDKNTVAGQTVEPLPFHGMDDARYGAAGQTNPDDAAHRRFREEFLTRPGGPTGRQTSWGRWA